MSEIRLERTEHGLIFGPAEVSAMTSDAKGGWVCLSLNTPKQSLQIYVTRTGKVRVFDQVKGELR